MSGLTAEQKALVNETLDRAAAACQTVYDELEELSHDYDAGVGHACDKCVEKIRALKVT